MDEIEKYKAEVAANIDALALDGDIKALSRLWVRMTAPYKYSYNFRWLGRPAIQFPQDLIAMQELIWDIRPEVIVETGIAHGGSVIFHASMLHLLGGAGEVIAVDIDIRDHNRREIEAHPMAQRISLIQGSSVEPAVVAQVKAKVAGRKPAIVILDSNHTHAHVLEELRAYAPLVGRGSYLIVMDTLIEDVPSGFFPDRPWGKGNNPKTAVDEFLRTTTRFVADDKIDAKLSISVAPGGYLACVHD